MGDAFVASAGVVEVLDEELINEAVGDCESEVERAASAERAE